MVTGTGVVGFGGNKEPLKTGYSSVPINGYYRFPSSLSIRVLFGSIIINSC